MGSKDYSSQLAGLDCGKFRLYVTSLGWASPFYAAVLDLAPLLFPPGPPLDSARACTARQCDPFEQHYRPFLSISHFCACICLSGCSCFTGLLPVSIRTFSTSYTNRLIALYGGRSPLVVISYPQPRFICSAIQLKQPSSVKQHENR